jgi:hypothetical protein
MARRARDLGRTSACGVRRVRTGGSLARRGGAGRELRDCAAGIGESARAHTNARREGWQHMRQRARSGVAARRATHTPPLRSCRQRVRTRLLEQHRRHSGSGGEAG